MHVVNNTRCILWEKRREYEVVWVTVRTLLVVLGAMVITAEVKCADNDKSRNVVMVYR